MSITKKRKVLPSRKLVKGHTMSKAKLVRWYGLLSFMLNLHLVTLLVIFIIPFALYLHHLSPSVYGGDVGDFLTAIAVKGVAHPSGYPLFTLLGIVFSHFPVSQTLAWKVGLISVISSAVSVVFLYLIVLELVKKGTLAFIAAFTLAFSYIFWLYAEVAEVFALTNLFILLLLYLAIRFYKTRRIIYLYALSFFAGLSLTHHEFIVLLFPSLLLLTVGADHRRILHPRIFLPCLLLFILALLPYVYIPIAASQNPPINWDNVVTVKNFIRLVLRLDYGWQGDSEGVSMSLRLLALKTYVLDLWTKLSPTVIITSALGMVWLLGKKKYMLFSSLFLGFFLTGPSFVLYGFRPPDETFGHGVVERFYMFSTIFLCIFFPLGISFIVETLQRRLLRLSAVFSKKLYAYIFGLPFLIVPFVFATANWQKTDLHDVWIGDLLALDMLSPLPENSTLFLAGDSELFNTQYAHYALGVRKDIEIVSLGAPASSHIFYEKRHEIMEKDKNVSETEADFQTLLSLAREVSVFSNVTLFYKDRDGKELLWIPYGLVYKLGSQTDSAMSKEAYLAEQEAILQSFHLPRNLKSPTYVNLTISDIPILYAEAYVGVGDYLIFRYNDWEKAREYYEKALSYKENTYGAYIGLGNYYLNKVACEDAERLFNNALTLRVERKIAYAMLYETYNMCFQNKQKAKQTANTFFETFGTSLYAEMKIR